MYRALAALTVAAYLTLAVGLTGAERPVPALGTGLVYLVLATLGFAWVRRRGARWWSVAYVAVQLALGYAVFALAGASVGAVLLLLVLVAGLPRPAGFDQFLLNSQIVDSARALS